LFILIPDVAVKAAALRGSGISFRHLFLVVGNTHVLNGVITKVFHAANSLEAWKRNSESTYRNRGRTRRASW
jgi:hypothetical protein